MKPLRIVLCLVALSSVVSAQTENGFRGYKWGTDVSEMRTQFALKLKEKGDDEEFYSSNVKTIGDARLKECLCVFYKKKFADVVIHTSGWVESKKLLEILKETYGPVSAIPGHPESRLWEGDELTLLGNETILSYDQDLGNGSATVLFRSRPISEQQKADKLGRVQKAKKDL
jgi:hypothetical protein